MLLELAWLFCLGVTVLLVYGKLVLFPSSLHHQKVVRCNSSLWPVFSKADYI